jgi:hypothetical protein
VHTHRVRIYLTRRLLGEGAPGVMGALIPTGLQVFYAGHDVGMEGEYSLKEYVRVLHWARVCIVATPAGRPQVQVSPDACTWLTGPYGPDAWTSVPPDFKAAAESGAMLALAHVSEPLAVTVTTIEFTPADTTPDDVKFAAAHAVWQAIGHAPPSHACIDADGVHFPPPTSQS